MTLFFTLRSSTRAVRPGNSMKVGAGHRLYGKTHSEPA